MVPLPSTPTPLVFYFPWASLSIVPVHSSVLLTLLAHDFSGANMFSSCLREEQLHLFFSVFGAINSLAWKAGFFYNFFLYPFWSGSSQKQILILKDLKDLKDSVLVAYLEENTGRGDRKVWAAEMV